MKMWDVTFASPTDVYAVGVGNPIADIYGLVLKSEDGGVSYDVLAYQVCDLILCTDPDYLQGVSFGSSNHGIAVGQKGRVWTIKHDVATRVASGVPDHLRAVSMTDSLTATAVGNSGKILRSTDGGDTWSPQISGTLNDLFAVSFVDAMTGAVVGAQGTVLYTIDGGSTWTPQVSGTTEWLFGVGFLDASRGVAVGGNGLALITTNGGAYWSSEFTPAQYNLRDGAVATGRTVAVGDGQSILNRLFPITGVDESQPVTHRLFPNHPNPFNPSTTIRYSLGHAQHVELVVFDVRGKRVATLIDGPRGQGEHSATWNGRTDDGRAVASGVYFCHLRTKNSVETRKLVLLK